MITQDLGIATAYGYAKSKGYTGTEAEFAELMASYASTAQTAIEAADRAVEANTAAQSAKTSAQSSASTASTAAQTATSKASEAVTAAGTATTKALEASTSAQSANQSAESAGTSAQTATTAATTATTKASEASESAATATTAKTDAETARDAAAQSASEAAASAESIDPDEFNRKIYAAFATDIATGSIASFPDGADGIPLKSLVVDINLVQDLSHGDPSPENICPISGWTSVGVNHSGADMTNPTTITINLGQTIYGGHLDVISGVLTADRAMVDLGSLSWSRYTGGANIPVFYASYDIQNMKPGNGNNAKCSIYRCQGWTSLNSRIDKSVEIHPTIGRPYIADSAYTDAETFKSAMSGVQLCYILAEPITYQLTPTEIRSLLGTNNIFADTGDSTVEYRADTTMYINRKIAEAVSALS